MCVSMSIFDCHVTDLVSLSLSLSLNRQYTLALPRHTHTYVHTLYVQKLLLTTAADEIQRFISS